MQYKLKDYLGKVSIFIFLITLTIAATIWAIPLYKFTLHYLDVPNKIGMSYHTILNNYYILMKYLHAPWIQELSLPNFAVSADGAFHFYEVKILFLINYFLFIISMIIVCFYLKDLKKMNQLWRLAELFKWAIITPFALLFMLVIDFNWFFEMFHKILFNNDAWLFDPVTDPIINALPQEFFMYSFIFAFIFLELSFIIGYLYVKKNSHIN